MDTKTIPFVSIIMPTYNHASFLSKALKSVVDQTYKNWEVIIIDNHSTDETDKVINKFNDPRIKYLKIINNGVLVKSRNLDINAAKGEWIAFLDSDDWWNEDKLEICLNEINKNTDFIYHDLEVVHKSKTFFRKKIYKGRQLKKPIFNDLLIGAITAGNAIGQSSAMMRKSILIKIGGLDENKNLVGSEDYNTWLRIAEITDQFKYVKKNLGYILIHDSNVSNKDMSVPQRHAVINFMKLFNSQQKISLEVKLRYMSGSYDYLNNNHLKAKNDFLFVLRNGPAHLKLKSLIKIILMMLKK